MSDTPRTDAMEKRTSNDHGSTWPDEWKSHARQLERELAALTARCGQIDGLKGRIAELNLALDKIHKHRDYWQDQSEKQLAGKTALQNAVLAILASLDERGLPFDQTRFHAACDTARCLIYKKSRTGQEPA